MAPSFLLAPALRPGHAMLPADLLIQFEPWRSQTDGLSQAFWDPLVWDGIAQYYPWRLFSAEALRAGRIPLWNPYQFCGTPFLANGQSAVLYPFNALFMILSVPIAFGWSAWFHLVLTAWFLYLFLRAIRVGRTGALCGAIVWQLNSLFIAWIHLPTLLCTVTWLPLIILFCEGALTSGRMRHALGAGWALAFSYLGGHPQFFLLVIMLTGAYLVARGLIPEVRIRLVAKTGIIIGAVAFGLSTAQLLPTLDLLRIAHRTFTPGSESYSFYLSRALQPLQLIGLLLPHPFGHPNLGSYIGPENYAEFTIYLGIAALGFALVGGVFIKTWHARFYGAVAIVTMLIVLGTAINYPLYHYLPLFNRTGSPARVLLLVIFCSSVLAGMGADFVVRIMASRKSVVSTIILMLFVLLGLGVVAWEQTGGRAVIEFQPGVIKLSHVEVMRALILIGLAVGCILIARLRTPVWIARMGIPILLATDLLLAAQHHIHAVPQKWIYSREANPGPVSGRIIGNAQDWPARRFPWAALPPNAATVYHLRDVFGYDSLYFAHYRDFASLIQGGEPSPPLNGNLLLARLEKVYGRDMIKLTGVSTILSPVPLKGFPIEREGAFFTHTDPQPWPRAWVVESAVFAPTHREAFLSFTRLGARQDVILITGPDQPAPDSSTAAQQTAQVRDLSPNALAVDLPQRGGGYLFLADSYAPGWRAYADGHELPIRIADLTFRAVPLPREISSVIFKYKPGSYGVGMFVTLATLAMLATILSFTALTKRP